MKAICFCRVSSNQQDLTAQREAVIEAIRKDGFKDEDIIFVEGRRKLVKDSLAMVICKRSEKWTWTITAEPKLDLKIGIALPTYIYRFAGGRKHLSKCVGGREIVLI